MKEFINENIKLYNGCCVAGMAKLEAKSQHIIIVDPPYFEVKGDFDFKWRSFSEYLKDVRDWAIECKRVLADNGTLFWWGHAKTIAYTQIILDSHFTLCNSLVWKKTECQTRAQNIEQARVFIPVTERLLMYSTDWDISSLDKMMFNESNFKNIKDYLKSQKKEVMTKFSFSSKEFNEYTLSLGCSTTPYKNWFCNTSFWEMATERNYKLIQQSGFFQRPYSELRNEYEKLRNEYEKLRVEEDEKRRHFNNVMKLEDVLNFSQEAHITGKFDHPTQKPPILCKSIISTCSKNGQNMLVPFAGSGAEVIAGVKCGLNVTGFELDEKYFNDSIKRIKQETAQLSLF